MGLTKNSPFFLFVLDPLFSFFFPKWKLSSFVDFCPQTIIMATHSPARVVLMLIGMLTFLAAITFNSLSGFGAKSGEFYLLFKSTFCKVCCGAYNLLCLSQCRCFQAEHRGCDTEVYNTHNPCSVGSVCLGLHICLDFCYVYILSSGTL